MNDPRNNHGAALLMIADLNRKVADKDAEIELLHSQISDRLAVGIPAGRMSIEGCGWIFKKETECKLHWADKK